MEGLMFLMILAFLALFVAFAALVMKETNKERLRMKPGWLTQHGENCRAAPALYLPAFRAGVYRSRDGISPCDRDQYYGSRKLLPRPELAWLRHNEKLAVLARQNGASKEETDLLLERGRNTFWRALLARREEELAVAAYVALETAALNRARGLTPPVQQGQG